MAVDDELAMAAQLLLRDRFVLREEDPEGFFLVRRHERALREFFREKLGWTLLMNMRFYKLEKVPAARAHPRDEVSRGGAAHPRGGR